MKERVPSRVKHVGKHQARPGSRGSEVPVGKSLHCGFCRNRSGVVSRLRTGRCESSQWALGNQGCLRVPGTWSLGMCSGDNGLERERPMKEMAGGVDSASVGLHLKSMCFILTIAF